LNSAAARDVSIIAALMALNVYIALDLFRTEYLSHMESIEAAYIGISRYILDHGFGLDWFPLWYVGIPFQNTYPPLLHALVAAVAWIGRVSPAHAHHITAAALYCVAPAFVYLLSRQLSGDWRVASAAALLYSLTTPSALLAHSVRSWAGPADPARFFSIIWYGDSPHVASVALIPLAILAIHWALEGASPLRIYVAALAAAAVVLTNWLGAFALALSVAGYLLARSALGLINRNALLRVAVIAIMGYACAMPWIPPSTIARVQHNAQYVIGKYPITAAHVLYAVPVLGLAALLWLALRRFRASLLCGFACFLALFTGALVVTANYSDVSLMPQPHRYHHEMDLSLSIAAVCLIAAVLRRIDRRITASVLIALLPLAVMQARHMRRRARVKVGSLEITRTVEYQVATWLQKNLPARRVFATGSIQFWLNAFSDTPQVGGGFGQGIANDQIPVVHFGVPWTKGDGADAAAWLKLYGAAAVVVAEPGTRDAFPDGWRDPAKFRGVLPEIYRNGADVIYRVPSRSDSLAHVIRRDAVVSRPPYNNSDLDPAKPLLSDLDDPALPMATMHCRRPGDCVIRGEVGLDYVVFVQMTYHRGWRAYVDGEQRPIRRDGLGFMVIQPQCSGPCEIRLIYDGGLEMTAAKAACLGANAVGVAWVFLAVFRRPGKRWTRDAKGRTSDTEPIRAH
jgi:hypothetical protein